MCVDNLQPDFLYDHIQPVRTDLIQGLWKTLRSSNDSIAQSAYRILGKLGGSNRKMMDEPQRLTFNALENDINTVLIRLKFYHVTDFIELSLEKVIKYYIFKNYK